MELTKEELQKLEEERIEHEAYVQKREEELAKIEAQLRADEKYKGYLMLSGLGRNGNTEMYGCPDGKEIFVGYKIEPCHGVFRVDYGETNTTFSSDNVIFAPLSPFSIYNGKGKNRIVMKYWDMRNEDSPPASYNPMINIHGFDISKDVLDISEIIDPDGTETMDSIKSRLTLFSRYWPWLCIVPKDVNVGPWIVLMLHGNDPEGLCGNTIKVDDVDFTYKVAAHMIDNKVLIVKK